MYRYNLAILLTVGLFLIIFVGHFKKKSPWHRTPLAVAEELRAQSPQDLQTRTRSLARVLAVDLAVYQDDGQQLSMAGEQPLFALEPEELDALEPNKGEFVGGHRVAVELDAQRYLLLRWRGGDPAILLWGVGGVLLLLGLISWPRARAVARPLEAIMKITDRLGEGALNARVGPLPRAPKDMARLAEAIDQMADRINHLRQHERSLLAAVSHELRTPMARIRIALEWAAEEGTLPAQLEGAEADLAELESLVKDVLASVRLQTESTFPLKMRICNLAELARLEVAQFRRHHPNRSVELEVVEAECCVDPHLLRRVLNNLLSNAERYTDGSIRLEAELQDERYLFRVLDRGPGLSKEELMHLFEPFFRAESSRARVTGGVGMGMTLCKRIVEAHGGEIRADLRVGGGLSFQLWLPREDSSAGNFLRHREERVLS